MSDFANDIHIMMRMKAVIKKGGKQLAYRLDDRSRLVSHLGRFPDFDSALERDFAADFEKAGLKQYHHWRIARAVKSILKSSDSGPRSI